MARANAGPRRVPCRRSRVRHRTFQRISAGHQKAASLAPTLGAARTMEGPAAAAPIQSSARAGAQSIQSDSRATQAEALFRHSQQPVSAGNIP